MRSFAFLAAAGLITVCALTSCGDNSSSADTASYADTGSQSSETSAAPVISSEAPDVMAFFLGESDTEFIGMSKADFDEATGEIFTEKNAVTCEKSGENSLFAKYSLGKADSILNGRVPLSKEYDISCAFTFKDDKLIKVTVTAQPMSREEADAICEAFLKAFDGKLPEGYTQFKPSERGKVREVGFTRTKDDYCISVTRDENLDGEKYVHFDLQMYSERYGL